MSGDDSRVTQGTPRVVLGKGKLEEVGASSGKLEKVRES